MQFSYYLGRQLWKRSFKNESQHSQAWTPASQVLHPPACFYWSKGNLQNIAVQLCLARGCSSPPFRQPGWKAGLLIEAATSGRPLQKRIYRKKIQLLLYHVPHRSLASCVAHIVQPSSSGNMVASNRPWASYRGCQASGLRHLCLGFFLECMLTFFSKGIRQNSNFFMKIGGQQSQRGRVWDDKYRYSPWRTWSS